MLDQLKYQPIHSIPESGEITAKSPSNIALVKYWGKNQFKSQLILQLVLR